MNYYQVMLFISLLFFSIQKKENNKNILNLVSNNTDRSIEFLLKKHSLKQIPDIDPSTWRGVNLPLLLNGKTQRDLSQEDFNYAASAGANVVRLNIHADPQERSSSSFISSSDVNNESKTSEGMKELKEAVNMAQNANLKVILDMHTMPGLTHAQLWTNQSYWDTLINIWTGITQEFKNNNTIVAFDLMNEPNIKDAIQPRGRDVGKMFNGTWSTPADWKNTPKDYNLQIANLINAIRRIDSNRYIIVEGFGYLGNPVNFNWMKPITGFDKIVYSFHMYIPTGLTMLGTKESMKKGNDEKEQPFKMPEDESEIDKAFAPVLAFQKKYNVPIYVGEFGITDKAVLGKDANGNSYNGACWLSTVIRKMNEYKWGWTYWDFWTDIRKPKSEDDPRYIILSAAMKDQPMNDYCK